MLFHKRGILALLCLLSIWRCNIRRLTIPVKLSIFHDCFPASDNGQCQTMRWVPYIQTIQFINILWIFCSGFVQFWKAMTKSCNLLSRWTLLAGSRRLQGKMVQEQEIRQQKTLQQRKTVCKVTAFSLHPSWETPFLGAIQRQDAPAPRPKILSVSDLLHMALRTRGDSRVVLPVIQRKQRQNGSPQGLTVLRTSGVPVISIGPCAQR